MIDCHCHLNLDPLKNDSQLHTKQALASGLKKIIIPGVNKESSEQAVKIANKYESCYAAIGLHPHEADQILTNGTSLDELKVWFSKLSQDPKVIAIGECGLDYYRLENNQQRKHTIAAQKKLFKLQLHIAHQLNLPTIIHVRASPSEAPASEDAHNDTINILKSHQVRGVLHCFSGDQNYLQSALDLGLYISFAGNITFKNSTNLQKLVKLVPSNRLLLETDAPFLNPDRGDWPNTPSNITKTYSYIAKLLNIPIETLITQTSQNVTDLFGI